MAYSLNPETCESRRYMLRDLEAGRPQKWSVAKDALITRRTANQIREALWIASRHPQRFPKLAKAAERFSIFIVADGLIEARVKGTGRTETSRESTSTHEGNIIGDERASLVGLSTAAEVIESWKAHLPSSDALHFTQTTLPDAELAELYTWARSWKPRLMFLVGDGTLTLSLFDITVKEYAWAPAPPAEEPEELDI